MVHPHAYDEGPVAGMCAFNNRDCPHGFILVSVTSMIKICQLPMDVSGG